MVLFSLCLGLLWGQSCAASPIDPELEAVLEKVQGDERLPVIIKLRPLPDGKELQDESSSVSREAFILTLQERAKESQQAILDLLEAEKKAGRADNVRSIWITNSIAVEATPDVIQVLAVRDDVLEIILDREIPVPSVSFPTDEGENPEP